MISIAESWKEQYPRPQRVRKSFLSLDGSWQLNKKTIQVPFCMEASASEYQGAPEPRMHYEKVFSLPEGFYETGQRVWLHFGAVDQTCRVLVNGHPAGEHEGGYLPFSMDITDFLEKENLLEVEAEDFLDREYPYGKQSAAPKGMWYTPVSGIWQSVWLEAYDPNGIRDVHTRADDSQVVFEIESPSDAFELEIRTSQGIFRKKLNSGRAVIPARELETSPRLWSPEDPYLYEYTLRTGRDEVEGYFALRTVEIIRSENGPLVYLNHRPVFMQGVLDQGYFESGLYLPLTPKEYENDILAMKEMGFNLLRKHIKVEPDLYYALCDKHGMLVMQDFVNSGPYDYVKDTVLPTLGLARKDDTRQKVSEKRRRLFIESGMQTMKWLQNHPCVIAYTLFNEGWGQFNADEMYRLFKKQDPARLLDATSGWFHQKESDFYSLHIYFRNKCLKNRENQNPLFLSECGGYVLPVEGHTMANKKTYGYGSLENEEQFVQKLEAFFEDMILPSIEQGLCGYVYTQLSDVEGELNGFLTYDRKACKVSKESVARLTKKAEDAFLKRNARPQ